MIFISKTNKKHWLLKIFLTLFLLFILSISIGAIYINKNLYSELDLNLIRTGSSSVTKIYYFDYENREKRVGEAKELENEEIFLEKSEWCSYYNMPEYLYNAFIAVEDHRFFEHNGVDWLRTSKATLNYIFKFDKSGYGGSTITQQLIKNLTGDDDVSPKRKIEEIMRATDIEKKLGKIEILELYLNVVYLSENCYGVGAASKLYFGKNPEDLSLAECASLASIVKNPNKYDPYKCPENNFERRKIVLKQMLNYEMISEEEYNEACAEELNINLNIEDERTSGVYSWFTEALINDISEDLCKEYGITKKNALMMIMKGGLNIYSTIDPEIQKSADEVFQNYKAYILPSNGEYPQNSCVIIDNKTSDVVAIIGGNGKKNANRIFNRAVSAHRAPGSVIKPLSVYAPGVESKLITMATSYDDTPFTVKDGVTWPKNSPNIYRGLVCVNYALEHSLNTISVKILNDFGINDSYNFLRDKFEFDLAETDKNSAPLALGQLTNGESLIDITNAYSSFANGGYISKPRTYLYVTDNYGNVILNNEKQTKKVISEETSTIMTAMLKNVVKNGTAKGMNISNLIEVAGKTGTSSDNHDKWFIGYTPDYVCGVWTGFDTPKEMSYSKNPSLQLFDAVMSKVYKNAELNTEFDIYGDLVEKEYCVDSGCVPTDACRLDPRGNRIEKGYFIRGTEPKESCEIHRTVYIDSDGNIVDTEKAKFNYKKIALLDYHRDETFKDISISDSEYLIENRKKK